MTLQEKTQLSFFQTVTELSGSHSVWLVRHTVTGRLYVRKQLAHFDLAVLSWLRDHPVSHMPRIIWFAEEGDTLVLIEEYISGETLEERLIREGVLPEAEACRILCELCTIVQGLHSAAPPIIHRDIKPSNVLISSSETVYLLDIDAAKNYRPGQNRDTQFIGTEGYAAPEQYGFGASGLQTDLYALGVLLNKMLTGAYPQDRLAGGRYGRIVEKCTALDSRKRFRSAEELRRMLGGQKEAADGAFRLALPGFREKKPLYMILCSLVYFFIFLLSIFSESETAKTVAGNWFKKFTMFADCFLTFFIPFNLWAYLKERKPRFPLWARILAVLAAIFITVVFIRGCNELIETLFYGE